jgi:hypothetical protein
MTTATVAVAATAMVRVVAAGVACSLMLAHGWTAVPNAARVGSVARSPHPVYRGLHHRRHRSQAILVLKERGGKRRKTVRAKRPLHPSPVPALVRVLALLRHRPRAAARPSSGFRLRSRINPHRPLYPSLSEVRMLDDRWRRYEGMHTRPPSLPFLLFFAFSIVTFLVVLYY